MRIDVKKLEALGVDFSFDRNLNVIRFCRIKWDEKQIVHFQEFVELLDLTSREEDELNEFLEKLVIMRALRNAS